MQLTTEKQYDEGWSVEDRSDTILDAEEGSEVNCGNCAFCRFPGGEPDCTKWCVEVHEGETCFLFKGYQK
jgi:hypothetical protein